MVGSVRCSVIKQAVVRPPHHARQARPGCAQIYCWGLARVVSHRTHTESALEHQCKTRTRGRVDTSVGCNKVTAQSTE